MTASSSSSNGPSRLSAVLDRLAKQSAARRKEEVSPAPVGTTESVPAEAKVIADTKGSPVSDDIFGGTSQSATSAKYFEGNASTPATPSTTSAFDATRPARGGMLSARVAALSGNLTARIVRGDVHVETSADLEALRGISAITGTLTLTGDAIAPASLAALQSLTEVGGLVLEGVAAGLNGAREVEATAGLMKLERVLGTVYLGFNPALEQVSLPQLKSVGGAFVVEGNANLVRVLMPQLQQVERYLHICEHAQLTSIALPALASVDELAFTDNPLLQAVHFPRLDGAPPHVDQQGSDQSVLTFGGMPLR